MYSPARCVAASAAVVLTLCGPGVTSSAAQASPASLVITHVTVIDVEHGLRLRDRTVVVEGRRIARVEPTASARTPAEARVVDGRGKYMIPGLWDMHVHALQLGRASWMFPLFLANGVTGIRDTGSPLDSLLSYRRRVSAGEVLGPRIVGSGPILDVPAGTASSRGGAVTPVISAHEARRTVDSLADAGVDFIKIYEGLSRDAFFAIAGEASARGIPIAGHVPFALTAFEASDAGLKSIEHLGRVPDVCIPDSVERVLDAEDAAARARRPVISPDSQQALWVRMNHREAAAFDERLCVQAGARFARNGTWQVPTLELQHRLGRRFLASDSILTDPRLRHVPAAIRSYWMRGRDSTLAHPFRGLDNDSRYPTYVRVARALVRGGDGLLAGTDTGWPFVLPGFGLHGELVAFVRDVRLTPLAALRSATLGPAQFFGATDSLGAVAEGKLADLVLLDGDPLADIRNAQRIRAVVANGRYLDRRALDSLLAGSGRIVTGAMPSR